MDIQPGSTVKVTVKSRPRSAGARKTLARVFLHDPAIRKSRPSGPKPAKSKIRGGRVWTHPRSGSAAIVPDVGDTASIHATVDVIRDLQSLGSVIEVA